MRRTITLVLTTFALVALLQVPDAGADSFNLTIGRGHFGISVSSNDWGVYRDSWHDSHWQLDFHSALDGHGEWVRLHGLGQVWRPWVAADWQPYTHGRWVHSRYGWTWVSYEPWGYVPHHYGEWALSSAGWVWVPGYVYRPANVIWVSRGSYVGWYPRGPRGWSHAGHAYRNGRRHGYRDGYWEGWHDARHATWVEWRHFGAENLSRHALGSQAIYRSRNRAPKILGKAPTTVEIRRRGATVRQVEMEHRRSTVNGRQVTVARPRGMSDTVARNAGRTAKRALSRPRSTPARGITSKRAPVSRRGSRDVAGGPLGKTHRDSASVRRRHDSPSQRVQPVPPSSRRPDSRRLEQRRESDRQKTTMRSPRSGHGAVRSTGTRSSVRKHRATTRHQSESKRSVRIQSRERSRRTVDRSTESPGNRKGRTSVRSQRVDKRSESRSSKSRRQAVPKHKQRRSRSR